MKLQEKATYKILQLKMKIGRILCHIFGCRPYVKNGSVFISCKRGGVK